MGEKSRLIIAEWGCEKFAEGARQAVKIALDKKKSERKASKDSERIAEGRQQETEILSDSRRFPFFRHTASVLLMLALDIHQRLRQLVSRTFLSVALAVISVSLLAMVVSGLLALRQVTHSVESLIDDAMVGLEASVAMRATVREVQLDLFRVQLRQDQQLSDSKWATFENRMQNLLEYYRTGSFDPEDEANAQRIEQRLVIFRQDLHPAIDRLNPSVELVRAADKSARELVDAVEMAYQFNRQRVHVSAEQASAAARRTLTIYYRLWWSFGIFTVLIAIIYFAYRWLAFPDDARS